MNYNIARVFSVKAHFDPTQFGFSSPVEDLRCKRGMAWKLETVWFIGEKPHHHEKETDRQIYSWMNE